MVTAIPKTNTNLAGLVLVLVPCVPSWRQIDVARPDFRGANWKRCVSYFTLRNHHYFDGNNKGPLYQCAQTPTRVVPAFGEIPRDRAQHGCKQRARRQS